MKLTNCQMAHICKIKKTDARTSWQKTRGTLQELILVSAGNPVRFGYFKSDLALRQEQERHLRMNRYAIHPFSRFRGMYEIALVVLYLNALLVKPMCTFLKIEHYTETIFKEYTIILDMLCWVDIIMTFFTGYIAETKASNAVILRFSTIARHYIFSPYFICDILSSIPKGVLCYPGTVHIFRKTPAIALTLDLLMYLKIVRITSLFVYIYRSAQYLDIKSKTVPFFSCVLLTTLITVHWGACLQYGVSRITSFLVPDLKNQTWIHRRNITQFSVFQRYNHAFFKTSAYILGVRLSLYGIEVGQEYVIILITYFVGKILVSFVWLILAMSILKARSISIKFLELIDQLEEYMRRKKLPLNLKERITQYYNFKYQRKYFKEDLIRSVLPDNIKNEVRMHICKTMIKNVTIFADLSYDELNNMVEHLVPEIFLPQDTIIQHGTYGDAMYFLFSGTVAVYTRSGKEICHLQDGAYFGEISLLIPDQTRNASIIAVETSQVYRLNKRDFERCLLRNKKVLEKIMQGAEERLKEATRIEEEYKKLLFEQTYQVATFEDKR